MIVFEIIKNGLLNPRHYIQSITLRWRHIHLLIAVLSAIITGIMMFQVSSIIRNLGTEMSGAKEFLPQYQILNGTLILDETDKPLYYETGQFQLVIDNQIEAQGNHLELPDNKSKMINLEKDFGLYIVKNNAFLNVNRLIQSVPGYDYLLSNPHRLSLFLDYIQDTQLLIMILVFLTLWVINSILLWMQIFLLGLLAGVINSQLTLSISLAGRMKLAATISFVPMILINLLMLLIPGYNVSFIFVAGITLFILYLAFKKHTEYISGLVSQLNAEELAIYHREQERMWQEDQEALYGKKKAKKKKDQENSNKK